MISLSAPQTGKKPHYKVIEISFLRYFVLGRLTVEHWPIVNIIIHIRGKAVQKIAQSLYRTQWPFGALNICGSVGQIPLHKANVWNIFIWTTSPKNLHICRHPISENVNAVAKNQPLKQIMRIESNMLQPAHMNFSVTTRDP